MAPPSGVKRHALDRADGEPRQKRKRVDATAHAAMGLNKKSDRAYDPDEVPNLVDFTKMPIEALYHYLAQHDLIPPIQPSPLSAEDPPPPFVLRKPPHHSSRAPTPPPINPTSSNNNRRDSVLNRRRSSRLLEEDVPHRTPVLADIDAVHEELAKIAQAHFREHSVKEVDTLASFMCAVKSKNTPPRYVIW